MLNGPHCIQFLFQRGGEAKRKCVANFYALENEIKRATHTAALGSSENA